MVDIFVKIFCGLWVLEPFFERGGGAAHPHMPPLAGDWVIENKKGVGSFSVLVRAFN
jgi:hypothetical protein